MRAVRRPGVPCQAREADVSPGQARPAGVLILAFLALAARGAPADEPGARAPVPDRLVVLTFDDSVKSHYTVAREVLKRHGFGATFFVTEGFTFRTNKKDYMTWEEIAALHRDGFEIGNHTRDHMAVRAADLGKLEEQLRGIDDACAAAGIPRPVSFAWPANVILEEALPILRRHGIRFARRGGPPEHPVEKGRGVAYEPGLDHPLLIPSAGDAKPDWTLDDFAAAVKQARDGKIAVIQFHGVPEGEHPWVHTPQERFEEYMKYLHDEGYRAVALRDLERFVDSGRLPADPMEVVRLRRDRLELAAPGVEPGSALTLYDLVGRGLRGTRGNWGFSTYLQFGGQTILFDTGNDPGRGEGEELAPGTDPAKPKPAAGAAGDAVPFLGDNARRLGADLAAAELLIISHRHRDHAGGIPQFRKANPRAPIYAPEAALEHAGPPVEVQVVNESRVLAPGRWLLRTENKEMALPELSLALDTPRGIVLVTGCCHPGVETIVKEALAVTGRPIHLLYGGFHLFPVPPDEVRALGRRLLEVHRVERVAPAHCSGWPEGEKTDTEAIFREIWGPERFRYGRLEGRLYFPGPAK